MTSDENELDADDVTLPAGGDVVAQIRAHAAKVRQGEASSDDVQVWTPAEPDPNQDDGEHAESGQRFTGASDRLLLPHDETVAFSAEPPVIDLRRQRQAAVEAGDSLIDGLAPPDVSATFWTSDQPFRASGIDAEPRRSQTNSAPLWMWVAVLSFFIVAVSVAIALVVA